MSFVTEDDRIGVRSIPHPQAYFLTEYSQTMGWFYPHPQLEEEAEAPRKSTTCTRPHSEEVKGCACQDGHCGFHGMGLGSTMDSVEETYEFAVAAATN